MSDPNPPTDAAHRSGNGARYLFLVLLGLVIGAVATVMAMRALDARKDHFPDSVMHVQQWHMAQLKSKMDENRCAPTDSLPHLQTLRVLANDLDPAFPDLRDDKRFADHSSKLRASLDTSLSRPPLNCAGMATTVQDLGEACKACHQDFRG